RRPVVGLPGPRGTRHGPFCPRRGGPHRRRAAPDRRSALPGPDGGQRGAGLLRRRRRGRQVEGRPGMSLTPFIVLSAILFTIGAVGVLTRRNAIVVFMCVELMLNACNLALVSFAKQHGNLDGQI